MCRLNSVTVVTLVNDIRKVGWDACFRPDLVGFTGIITTFDY